MDARRQAQARYREKNLEEEREKARERMARYRKKVLTQEDSGAAAAFLERAGEASRKHRQKNAAALAHRQRIIRLEAYNRKHGHHAWLKRHNLQADRRAQAEEHHQETASSPAGTFHAFPSDDSPTCHATTASTFHPAFPNGGSPTCHTASAATSQLHFSFQTMPPVPPSPLAMMDPVEAFARMGVVDPSARMCPPKQWAIARVNKFFAQRIDALDHFFTLHLGQASIMSSRNVHKLRAHIRGEDYDAQPGHALDSGEER
ncbi:hypothetical protein B0H14DRAFT_3538270 [Mycena olivaceomarginata]|nr:hypothetical protein B0H14DRAFT_3538270 [Mycena olivaceomarginata]